MSIKKDWNQMDLYSLCWCKNQ